MKGNDMTGLPKIKHPLYEIIIPSTKLQTTFRPFTVKEEKILLTAHESEDPKQISLAIRQIITNCVNDVDVNKLATFDVEYCLIKIRSKSVDNIAEFQIPNPENPKERIDVKINLNDIEVHYHENHTNKIKINDETMVVMRYPSFHEIEKIAGTSVDDSLALDIMLSCIDQIVSNDVSYTLSDFSNEEIQEFIESFTAEDTKKIKAFFDTMPEVKYEIKFTTKEGDEKTIIIQGTESFFM